MTPAQGSSNLRIKSYFAASVDGAIAQAREELGDDALLLNTRKLAGENGQASGYEVVFGLPGTQAAPVPPAPLFSSATTPKLTANTHRDVRPLFAESRPDPIRQTVRPKPAEAQPLRPAKSPIERAGGTACPTAEVAARVNTPAPRVENATRTPNPAREQETARDRNADLAGELGRLHEQMDELRSLIVKASSPQIAIGRTVPELADVYGRLMSSGVDSLICKDIVDRLEAAMATDAFFMRGDGARSTANRWKALRFDAARLEGFVRAELETRVAIEPMLGGDGEHEAVVVMVGPTGAGKTTSIMKLAASDLVAGRRVRILSLDPSRPGQTHLQSFASNLGMAFSPVQSVHALPAMIASRNNAGGEKELIFVDTPGYANTGDRAAELAALTIAKIQPADIHLVAPGYMKGADLRRSIQKYEVFKPTRILVTKLDESDTFGTVFSEAARAGLALSFFANGTTIPEDIRPVATEDLLSLALERKLTRTVQCA